MSAALGSVAPAKNEATVGAAWHTLKWMWINFASPWKVTLLRTKHGRGPRVTHVWDVAQYILQKQGPMTATKLEKLCYYSQAWHLVWDEEPMFPEPIQAWANGPVAPALYSRHRLEYIVSEVAGGNPGALTPTQADTVDMILDFYGPKSGAELSDLTHREAPWRDARGDIAPGARSQAVITHTSMAEYYEGLLGTSADK